MEDKIVSVNAALDLRISYQCWAYMGLIEGPLTLALRSSIANQIIEKIAVKEWGFKASDVLVIADNVDDYRDGVRFVTLTKEERLNLVLVADANDCYHLPMLFYDKQGSDMVKSAGRAIYQASSLDIYQGGYRKRKIAWEY